jgi:hypothetical protein
MTERATAGAPNQAKTGCMVPEGNSPPHGDSAFGAGVRKVTKIKGVYGQLYDC